MSKKFFVLFTVLAMILSAGVANATTNATYSGTYADYTISYDLAMDTDPSELDTTVEPIAGKNFKQTYQLPTLILDTNFNLATKQSGLLMSSDNNDLAYSDSQITYKWEVSGLKIDTEAVDSLKCTWGTNSDGKTLIISGVLPEKEASEYTISVDLTATVTSIDSSTAVDVENVVYFVESDYTENGTNATDAQKTKIYQEVRNALADKAKNLSVTTVIGIPVTSDDSIAEIKSDNPLFSVAPASGVTLDNVKEDYSVTVNASYDVVDDEPFYKYYISASETDENGKNIPDIELPTWLKISADKITYLSTTRNDLILSFDIVYKGDSQLEKGTPGRVRVKIVGPAVDEDTDTYLQWDVVYNGESEVVEPRPFGVSGSGEVNLSRTTSSDTKRFTYSASLPTSYRVARYETTGNIASLISSVTSTDYDPYDNYKGSISVTFSASSFNAGNTQYTGSMIFYDANGASADVAITVNVNGSTSGGDDTSPLSISVSPLTLTLEQYQTETLDFTANKTVSSWNISADSSVFSWDITSENTKMTVDLFVDGTAEPGEYTVTGTASDGTDEVSADVKVTVIKATNTSFDFSFADEPSSVSVTKGGTAEITLDASQGRRRKPLTFTVTKNDTDGIIFERKSGDTSRTKPTFTVQAASALDEGTYSVTVTASDGTDSKDKTISVNVTSSSSGGDDNPEPTYSFTLTASSSTLSLTVGGSSQTVTISSSNGTDTTTAWNATATGGLTVSPSNGTGFPASLTIAAPSGTSTGSKTVTVSANGASPLTINVTVTNSGNGGSGGTSSDVDPEQAQRQQDFINNESSVKFESVTEEEATAIGTARQRTDVFAIASENFGSTRTLAAVSSAEKEALADIGETSVLAGPTITPNQTGYAVFKADDDFLLKLLEAISVGLIEADKPIHLYLTVVTDSVSGGSVSTADSAAPVKGDILDSSGNEITTVPDSGTIYFAGDVKAGNTYSTVITQSSVASGDIPPSGAGCNGGFGALIGVLAMAFTGSALYIRRKEN